MDSLDNNDNKQTRKRGCLGTLGTLGIILITSIVSIIISVLVVNYYLFPNRLEPVELSQTEVSTLNSKLNQFGLLIDCLLYHFLYKI